MSKYRVTATRTDKPNHEAPRVSVRDGIRYRVEGTVLILGTSESLEAYTGDVRVEQTMGSARELLTRQGSAKIEIIVVDLKNQGENKNSNIRI